MSFQHRTDPWQKVGVPSEGSTLHGLRELPEPQLMVIRVSRQGIHISPGKLSSIPNHAYLGKIGGV